MKILLLGSKGQLAKEFLKLLKGEIYAYDIDRLDITDEKSLKECLDSVKPELLVNCSAYNNVDKAETDYSNAFKVNALAVKNMALFSEKYKTKIIHFSTDYVFPGKNKQEPYSENEKTAPLNKYGKSKLEGERFLLAASAESLVFRVSWLYGEGEQNFIYKLKKWSETKKELGISSDEISVPTPARLAAETALLGFEKGLKGLWHLVPAGFASRYEWARSVMTSLNPSVSINEARQADFNLPAKRPSFSALSSGRLSGELSFEFKDWRTYLSEFLKTG